MTLFPLNSQASTPPHHLAWLATRSDGPTVVLLHGGTRTASDWAPVARVLGQTALRLLAVDLPGHGQSAAVGDGNFAAAARAVRQTLDHLEVDRCLLAGHSLGGMLAVALGAADPRVVGVLNVDGFGAGRPEQFDGFTPEEASRRLRPLQESSLEMLAATPDLLSAEDVEREVEEALRVAVGLGLDAQEADRLLRRGYRPAGAFVRRSPSAAVNRAMYASLREVDLQESYTRLRVPTSVLMARPAADGAAPQDRDFLQAFDRGIRRQLAEAVAAGAPLQLQDVPTGHLVLLEAPELVAGAVTELAATCFGTNRRGDP